MLMPFCQVRRHLPQAIVWLQAAPRGKSAGLLASPVGNPHDHDHVLICLPRALLERCIAATEVSPMHYGGEQWQLLQHWPWAAAAAALRHACMRQHQHLLHSQLTTNFTAGGSSNIVDQLVRGFWASQASASGTAAQASPAAASPVGQGGTAASCSRPQQPPHPRTAAVQRAHAAAGTSSGAAAIAARLEASRSAAAAQMPAPGGSPLSLLALLASAHAWSPVGAHVHIHAVEARRLRAATLRRRPAAGV